MSIEADDLVAGYNGHDVLHGVSLRAGAGELLGLIGPNGAGKSTLLRALSRTLPARRGAVRVDGEPVERMAARDLARRVAFVPQSEPALFEFTVREVVLMGRHAHVDPLVGETAADYDVVLRALAATDAVHLADRPITALSGGEHRRVLMARALCQSASTMLLDEPTAHLDLTHQAELLSVVRRLVNRDRVAVVVALHDLNLAAEFCDRLVLLAAGRVAADGRPDEVLVPGKLSEVYGAPIVVGRSPASGKPHVLPVAPPEPGDGGDALRIHVVCGGGTGLVVMAALQRRGYNVSAGVLNRLDSDEEAARALGIWAVTEAPFSRIGLDAVQACRELVDRADAIVVTSVPFGSGNLANLELALEAQSAGKPVLMLGGPNPEARDFAGGEGARMLGQLQVGGAIPVADVHALEVRLEEFRAARQTGT